MTPATVGARPRSALLLLAVVSLLYAALYARVKGFEFVWDDLTTIRDSPQFDHPLADSLRVTQHGHIDASLTRLRAVAPEHESYRPLLFLTFAAEVAVAGRSPAVMHVTNVVLGWLAALLAFGVASSLMGDRRAGVAVAALFVLHPLQVEPVSYISARADLLSAVLALASVALALRAAPADPHDRPRFTNALIAASAWLFAASLFVKEGTIGLPLGLAALWSIDRRRPLFRPILALAAVIPAYFLARAALLNGAPAMAHGGSVARGALAVPGLALQYLALFVAPVDLSIVRPLRSEYLVAGWLAVALGVAVAVQSRRRPTTAALDRSVWVAVFSGLSWAVVMVGPAAVVASLMGVAADRYACLPLFGFALAAVTLARAVWQARARWRSGLVAAIGAWGLLCVGVTHLGIGVWQDPYQLYANAVRSEPASSAARYGLGVVFANKGLWPQAIASFERAVAFDPANMRAWNNLSVAYERLGRLDQGEQAARRAIALSDGTHFRAWYNLATVHLRQQRRREACADLAQAHAINPAYEKANALRATTCVRQESDDGAR